MQNKKHKAPRSGSPIFGCHIRLLFRIVSIRRTLKSIYNRKFKILKFWFKSSTSVHCSQIVFYEPYCIYICWHTVGLVTVESGERSPDTWHADTGRWTLSVCQVSQKNAHLFKYEQIYLFIIWFEQPFQQRTFFMGHHLYCCCCELETLVGSIHFLK